MPADVTLLTTKAECDTALASLTKEKATYAHRDYNQTYADGVAADRATTTAASLAKATADVAHYTTEVARPGLSASELRAAQRSLNAAVYRRDNLTLTSGDLSGPTAYLTDVDADQVDAQLATLDAAIAAVTAHKATLP